MAITVADILNLAFQQEGYLEKASAKNEDSKTDNAGTNNYTKFGRDLAKNVGSPYADGVAWCDEFCDWLFWKLGGKQAIIENLYGMSAYTPTSAQYFKNNNAWYTGKAPKPGYQIFFKNTQRICHTGIVVKCEKGYVYTIEGNTSSAKGVVANGGCVRQKSYSVSYSNIAGYGIPKCAKEATVVKPVDQKTIDIMTTQMHLNKYIVPDLMKAGVLTAKLNEDGTYGKMTRQAILGYWKTEMNNQFKSGLDPKNVYFGPSCLSNSAKCILTKGSTGAFVVAAQLLLKAHGFYSGTIDGKMGDATCVAVVNFETRRNLIVESVANAKIGQQVWYALFN